MSSIFEQVKRGVSIKQVVERYGCKVNRAGQFICPFHSDTHPSASIKNDYFNCFVCGAAGDAITFTAKLFGLRNIDACKKLICDFNLPIETDRPLTKAERLKADREWQEIKRKKKEREQLDAEIERVGAVLADWHRFLWQGKEMYPADDKRHISALQELTTAQYYLDCFDAAPEDFTKTMRKQVNDIERRLHQCDNGGQ